MTDGPTLRIDKWLWYARFFRSRSQASRLATEGRIRVDGTVVSRAHHPVREGNVLTFPQARRIRVVRVVALGRRRGPASEARTLYEDLVGDDGSVVAAAPQDDRPAPPRTP